MIEAHFHGGPLHGQIHCLPQPDSTYRALEMRGEPIRIDRLTTGESVPLNIKPTEVIYRRGLYPANVLFPTKSGMSLLPGHDLEIYHYWVGNWADVEWQHRV